MKWSGKPILSFFGHLEPRHITKQLVKDYVTLRQHQNKKPWTIHTELSHLRSTLKFRKEDASSIVLQTPPPKHLYLTKDEAKRFIAACVYPHIRVFVYLAIGTGGRTQALLDLTWDRVDLDRKLIDLRTSEQKDYHKGRAIVPINNQLLTVRFSSTYLRKAAEALEL